MPGKIKVMALFICALFIGSIAFIPIFSLIHLTPNGNDSIPSKIMFDSSLLSSSNSRVIINVKPGVALDQVKADILTICEGSSDFVEFGFISAIAGQVPSDNLLEIASLDSVEKIYLDQEVKLDLEPSLALEFDEILQLNQCATIMNSRAVPTTGNGVKIAIIDTGIDFTHGDLSGKQVAQQSFVKVAYGFDPDEEEGSIDFNGHGTHCAGIATGTGAFSPAGYDLTGIAPEAMLLNAKALDQFGRGYLSSVIAALEWSIAQNADIISMSLGFSFSDPDHPICRAVDNATQQGIVVVVAAGNSGPFYSTIGSPGAARTVITVGATNRLDLLCNFSSRGSSGLGFTDPDVVAPGEDILSTIASASLLGAMMELEDYFVPGTSGSNYAILSGTSMACPMVAGAAALLLEAFPSLTPYMVRIALMKGADSIGYTPNEEGAGRVNVNNSYTILLQSNPTFNISTVLPNKLPIPPLDFSLFPGETYSDDVIILLGQPANLSITCSGNVSPYISLQNTTNNEIPVTSSFLKVLAQDSLFTNFEVVFDIPLNLPPGDYSGLIEIRDNDTNQLLETVELEFPVRSPLGRVYFDCFHNSDSADHARSNFYKFTKLLDENSIAITFGTSLLSFSLLTQYDILILPDIELPLTARELAAIKNYRDSGGHILILGSSYPQTSIESLNELLALLDSGINYTKNNIEDAYDLGLMTFYEDFLITDIDSHPITNGISKFSWLTGVPLGINPLKAFSIARYNSQPVIAINNQSNHKLVCMGFERLFYDDFITESYNQKLALQTIQWLLNDSARSNPLDLRVEVKVSQPILELGTDNKTIIGFHVSDPINGQYVDGLIPHINLSCTIDYYNAGWISVWIANASDILGLGSGAYSCNFTTNMIGLYRVLITVENLSSTHDGIGVTYFNTTIAMPKILSSSITTTAFDSPSEYDDVIAYDIYRDTDQVIFNITLYDADTNSDIKNVTCYLTSLDTYRSDIKYLTYEMANITPKSAAQTDYTLVIAPDNSFPAGTYHMFVETIDTDGNSDYSSILFEFYIDDKYPVLDLAQTTFKGSSLSSLQYSQPRLNLGKSFSVDITGTDEESTLSGMHAYVLIFTYFTIGFMAYLYEPVWGAEVPFSGSSFSGSLQLPANGQSQILDETYHLGGSYILIILLMDSDGQFEDDSYSGLLITIQPSFPITIIIVIVCILAGLAAFLYIWFRKKK